MNPIDTKILGLIDMLIAIGTIDYAKDFCAAIGMPKQSITRIKQGKAHFTAQHILNICKAYNINAKWIFEDQKNIFNPSQVNVVKELS